jgi:UDP-glucose 4-epimerase
MKPYKVLITGAAGLLGSNLAKWIIENQPAARVVGIDDLSGGYLENFPAEAWRPLYEESVEEGLDTLMEAFKPDIVYHFAAYAAECLSPFIRKFNYTNNLVNTAAVVNACIQHKAKLVFTSSAAVYGDCGYAILTEEGQCYPHDPYGVAKYACELDIEIANAQHGLEYTILRPHNVYGPRQNVWDRYRNALGIWMRQAHNDEPLTIFGDGTQTRCFSYIDDCLKPMWNAGVKSQLGSVYNIGSDVKTSIKEAALTVLKVVREVRGDFFGITESDDLIYLEQRHEVKNVQLNHDMAKRHLGLVDTTPLEDGVRTMYSWFLTQPTRPLVEYKSYEIEKGMYDAWKHPESIRNSS